MLEGTHTSSFFQNVGILFQKGKVGILLDRSPQRSSKTIFFADF